MDSGDAGRPPRRGVRMLCPDRFCAGGVTDVTPDDLAALGIEALVLDLDNTLVAWQSHDVPTPVRDWLESMRCAGVRMCLLSNTRFGRRLRALSADLHIPYVRRASKPFRRGFRAALRELASTPEHTAVIGDQMFTDVLGGNRMGIYTVMVAPMARREFVGTKVSRVAERMVLRYLRRRGMLREPDRAEKTCE